MFITHAEGVAYRPLAGEGGAVLLRLDNGQYHGLDAVGRMVWDLIGDGTTLDHLIDRLGTEVTGTPENLAAEIEEFVGSLADRGLVSVRVQR
jgi:hypothetical protein